MAVTVEFPKDLEARLRANSPNFDGDAREALSVELFRQGKLSHYELSTVLGLDRFQTNALLKRHRVTQGTLTMQDLDQQAGAVNGMLGPAH